MRSVFILDDEILLVLATSTNRQEGSAQETVLRDVIKASYESVCEIEIAEPADAGIVNAVEVTSGE
jgi:hypothetical protein